MFKRSLTKQAEFLTSVSQGNALFLDPGYIDFSNMSSNTEFVKSLNVLDKEICSEKIKNVIGSSGSAIIALLLGLGYSFKEIMDKLGDVNFYELLGEANKYSGPFLVEVNKVKQFKCLETDNLLAWVQQQITDKLGQPLATFLDLKNKVTEGALFKNIHVVVLNMKTGKLEILNYKNAPNLPLAIAIRICMSFCTKFSVVEIKNLVTNKKYTYADGGIVLQQLNLKEYKADNQTDPTELEWLWGNSSQ